MVEIRGPFFGPKKVRKSRHVTWASPAFEVTYGGMRSRDENEWARFNSILFTIGDLWWPVLQVPISCWSHRRWMTSVVIDRPCFASFRPPGAMVYFRYLGTLPGLISTCTDGHFDSLFIWAGFPPR